jgi:NACHT domain
MHRRSRLRRAVRDLGLAVLALAAMLIGLLAFSRYAPDTYRRVNEFTGGTFALVVSVLSVIPLLVGMFRQKPVGENTEEQLARIVRRLAEGVRKPWADVPAEQQLTAFQPLRVAWSTSGTFGGELREYLGNPAADLGSFHPDRGLDGPRSQWDEVAAVAKALARDTSAPGGRRLLIVGGAGAGKTVLAQYVADAVNHELASRTGEPSRVMVSLAVASWDPGDDRTGATALMEWIVEQLLEEYRYLRDPVIGSTPQDGSELECSVAYRLLRDGRLIPILDGLDEIPMPLRSEAIAKINELVPQNINLVITTRSQEYWAATQAPRPGGDGAPTGILIRAAVAGLLPFDAADIGTYLRDRLAAKGLAEDARWTPVLAALDSRIDPPTPLAAVLATPLMTWLAASVYVGQGNPGEMVARAEAGTLGPHLLDRFVPAAFRRPGRWRSVAKVEAWLRFLATDLHDRDEQRLAWWTIGNSHQLAVGLLVGLATGLTTWLAVGLALGFGLYNGAGVGAVASLTAGVLTGNVLGIGLGVACAAHPPLAPTNLEFRVRRQVWEALFGGLIVGGVAGVLFGVVFGADDGLFVGALLAAPIAVGYGAFASPRDAASPAALLRHDRWFVIAFVLAYGIPGAIVATLYFGGPAVGLPVGLAVGFTGGTINGIQYAIVKKWDQFGVVAWFRFTLVRAYCAVRGELPWRLMGFLADAHRRGVLRQDGGYYRFRHAQLQDSLAAPKMP